MYVKCGVELSPPSPLQEYFEEDLPVSSLGFTSVVHLLSHLPVCEIERPSGTGDWLVFTKGNKTPKGTYIISECGCGGGGVGVHAQALSNSI